MCPRAASILDTTFQNRINPDSVTNAMSRLGGKTFMGGVDPAWEWVPILNPNDEFDDSVAVACTVVNEHNSDKDLKFTHPFGGDYEFFIACDSAYESALAPSNDGRGGSDGPDKEYSEANSNALSVVHRAVPGSLGVEADGVFMPPEYRVSIGDRVVVLGRWIIDAGHDDFHAEIHPPLLVVAARSPSPAITHSTIVGRPYLISQNFRGKGLYSHLLEEIAKLEFPMCLPDCSTQIDVLSEIYTTPFSGIRLLSYTVRPSLRPSPDAKLVVRYHFPLERELRYKLRVITTVMA